MGIKSIQVPQPQFSEWITHRRQELALSAFDLKEKLYGRLSERTLKYLEDHKRESFSEETLKILADGLEISYLEILEIIETLKPNTLFRLGGKGRNKLKQRFWRPGLVVGIVAVISLTYMYLAGIKPSSPTGTHTINAFIDKSHLNIFYTEDGQGNRLWQKRLDTKVAKVVSYDLDGDGEVEIIAGTRKESYSDWGAQPGWLYVWNQSGELLTKYNLWKPSIYPAKEFQSTIIDFQVNDLDNDGIDEIVVLTRGIEWYPSRIAILNFKDGDLDERSTYWHPGFLNRFIITDLNQDGIKEIICIGANNDFKRVPSLRINRNINITFMLNGDHIAGQAPPYLGAYPQGSQKWFYYLTCQSSAVCNFVALSQDGANNDLVLLKTNSGCFFSLNYDGDIVNYFEGDSCRDLSELHLFKNTPEG